MASREPSPSITGASVAAAPPTPWTPGPWEVWEYGDPRVVAPGIGWTVFTIERPKPSEEPTHWANARLCSAAPELHDALAELVWIIERAGLHNLTRGVELGQTSWYIKASDRLAAALAALAKARGEA